LPGGCKSKFSPIPRSIKYISDARLRALAVTSATRSDALPEIPAVAEFVPGYVADVWHGIGAPKNTPMEIIKKLNKEINAVLAYPTIRARSEPMPMSTDEFGKFIANEIDKRAKVIKFANIKVD
jgi:tripartite-type tricarboxylate transporter receptor subunit TctC